GRVHEGGLNSPVSRPRSFAGVSLERSMLAAEVDTRRLFEQIAQTLTTSAPPGLEVRGLNAQFANFGRIDGNRSSKFQVRWKPEYLHVGLTFDRYPARAA